MRKIKLRKIIKIISAVLVIVSFFIAIDYVTTYVCSRNMLLQKPLKDNFTPKDRLERDWREEGFNMLGSKVDRFVTIFMEKSKDKRDFHFIVTYLNHLPDQLSEEQKKLFKQETRVINQKPMVFYNYSTGQMFGQQVKIQEEKHNQRIDSTLMKKGALEKKQKKKPQKINVKECAELIKNKKFMFYTGAGISVASAIPMGQQLRRDFLGYDGNKPVDELTRNIFFAPEKVIAGQEKFEETFKNATPTKAHYALAEIALKNNAHIMTSNIDRLHKQAGIRSWPVMTSYRKKYLYFIEKPEPVSGNYAYLQANPQWLKDIDFIVCIGMSHDVKGILAWYKKNNPNGRIIAINTDEVKYLDENDYFLQGDSQVIVPALKKELEK